MCYLLITCYFDNVLNVTDSVRAKLLPSNLMLGSKNVNAVLFEYLLKAAVAASQPTIRQHNVGFDKMTILIKKKKLEAGTE